MKRKLINLVLVLLVAVWIPALALGETTFDGYVTAGEETTVLAPFGGTVSALHVRAGQEVAFGQEIATIETTKVYASASGTISGVFGQTGDNVEDVASRSGAVLYIAPTGKYTITADIQRAYNNSDNKYVNIGETVYIKSYSSSNGNEAIGTITATDGTSYTVVTNEGELLMQETVVIYRSADYDTETRIGRGTVSRTAEVAVSGTGSIVYMHVKDGDTVTRGQLLFETLTGSLDGLYAAGNTIVSNVEGIIATVGAQVGGIVNKGDTVLTVYPRSAMQVQIEIDEYDLTSVHEGDVVSLAFNYADGKAQTFVGTVAMISHVSSAADGSDATYLAYIDFDADENIRLGMGAVATLDTGEDAALMDSDADDDALDSEP